MESKLIRNQDRLLSESCLMAWGSRPLLSTMPKDQVIENGSYPFSGWIVTTLRYTYMVIVAELVKRLIVVQEIVGSSPTFHTKECPRGETGKHIILKR